VATPSSVTCIADLLALPTTTPNGYREQLKAPNYLSYSVRLTLHSCPRRFILDKATAAPEEQDDNPDFLFGHSVAAGVQSYIAFGDRERALLDAFLAWNGSLDTIKEKSKKSVWFAIGAVESFIAMRASLLAGWEVAMIDGKPAVELAFAVDLQNGYHYLGHIDLILVNTATGQFMVLELKTTSFNAISEASYKNSDQAIGYSIVLDSLAKRMGIDSTNYMVLYLVYKTGSQEYETLPFLKSRADRASWLHDLLVDCLVADMYKQQQHYPMRGESCFSFFRPCEYFGICNIAKLVEKAASLKDVTGDGKVDGVDYYFTLEEVVNSELAGLPPTDDELAGI
jgi:PD-(D/E)XK nuclease superfamily